MATRKLNMDDVADETDVVEGGDAAFDQVVRFEDIKGDVLVPTAEYALRNVKIELKMSKSNQPKFVFQTLILDGEFEGTKKYFDFSWAPGAQPRSKAAFLGMGLPETFEGSMRQIAAELTDREYFGIIDQEQSDQIDSRTQKPYPARNRIVSTSSDRQTS